MNNIIKNKKLSITVLSVIALLSITLGIGLIAKLSSDKSSSLVAVTDKVIDENDWDSHTAVAFNKAPGLQLVKEVDLGYASTYSASLAQWTLYPNTGFFQGTRTTNAMTQADTNTYDDARSKVLEYMSKNCANFITGKSNFDKDWDKWCTVLKKYKVDSITDLLQYYVDNYPFR